MADEPGAAPVEGTPTSTPTTSGVDFSPVLDRMSELASGIGDMRTRLDSFDQRIPAPEAPAEPDPWQALYGEPQAEFDPNAWAQQQAPQFDPAQLQSIVEQRIQAGITDATQPLMSQLAQMQLQRDTEALYQQIPQLAPKPENAEIRQQTHQRVAESIAHLPREMQQALGNDPRYIATVFKAAEAEKLAAGQAPATSAVPSTESAGGALPGGNGEQQNIAQQIFANRGQAMPSGFGR